MGLTNSHPVRDHGSPFVDLLDIWAMSKDDRRQGAVGRVIRKEQFPMQREVCWLPRGETGEGAAGG
jgi:hypothetical protein